MHAAQPRAHAAFAAQQDLAARRILLVHRALVALAVLVARTSTAVSSPCRALMASRSHPHHLLHRHVRRFLTCPRGWLIGRHLAHLVLPPFCQCSVHHRDRRHHQHLQIRRCDLVAGKSGRHRRRHHHQCQRRCCSRPCSWPHPPRVSLSPSRCPARWSQASPLALPRGAFCCSFAYARSAAGAAGASMRTRRSSTAFGPISGA